MNTILALSFSIAIVYVVSSENGIAYARVSTTLAPELLADSPDSDYILLTDYVELLAPDYSLPADLDASPAPDYSPSADSAQSLAPDDSPFDEYEQDSMPPRYYDVTHYGAVADGKTDSSSAFLKAWEDACSHGGHSAFYVPNGTFYLEPVSFSGPCHNNNGSPKIEMVGTLRAPMSLHDFPSPEWIEFRNLNGLNLTGLYHKAILDGEGQESWSEAECRRVMKCHNFPTALKFVNVSQGTVRNISLLNSKAFHVGIHNCDSLEFSNVNIQAPGYSPNTDGIHVGLSNNINITSSTIGVGDDCVSIGPGSTNISVSFVHCGPGHGISVGSLGKDSNEKEVDGIYVSNCTINGTQNGVRIKTWPGAPPNRASNLVFEDIKMINVSNPIIIDQVYCPSNTCKSNKPSQVKISDVSFKNISGTYDNKSAVTLKCSTAVPCENVHIVDIHLNHTDPAASKKRGRFIARGGVHDLKVLNSHF